MAFFKSLSTKILVYSFLGLTALTTQAAETFKGTGAARIINSDKAAARKTALKSAIFDASTKQRSNQPSPNQTTNQASNKLSKDASKKAAKQASKPNYDPLEWIPDGLE